MNRRLGQALCWIACALLTLGPQRAHAADKKPHITGMFSSLGTVSEGGDFGGIEMWIVPSDQGYWVVFQESPDYPAAPVVAKLTVIGNEISFVIPPPSEF